jgi:hypothetical protein
MFSLATLSKINTRVEVAKARRRAKAMNNPGGHAKSAEKGQRPCKRKSVIFTQVEHPSGLSGEHDVVLDAIQEACLGG